MLIQLSPLWTVVINVFAWLIIHLSVSYIIHRMPHSYFAKERKWDAAFKWENNGQWYERIGIRKWKTILPDGGDFYQGGFAKKILENGSEEYLAKFLGETRRAEVTHWLSIPPALLFFMWNSIPIGWIMILYALVFNLPFIMIQRYNRFRLIRILGLKKNSIKKKRRDGIGYSERPYREEKDGTYSD